MRLRSLASALVVLSGIFALPANAQQTSTSAAQNPTALTLASSFTSDYRLLIRTSRPLFIRF